jgi:hypothetical protein
MNKTERDIDLIEHFCMQDTLECHDPYDIWMTDFGIRIKQLYNSNKLLGILPAAAVTIWDQFINNSARIGYKKQEYPTARATAALTLLNLYQTSGKKKHLKFAKKHVDWLVKNTCKGYSGLCWGLGFKWAAGDDLDYNENTPFSTHTPYILEAIHKYVKITGDSEYVKHIKSIFNFYENDVQVMYEDEETMATSYGPEKDRLVTNAVSYSLYAYTIFLQYFPEKEVMLQEKIRKLYNFIRSKQRADGSWLYEPDNPNSFIDCFHSCFVLKNIYKANQMVNLPDAKNVLASGYAYVKDNFFNPRQKLFKRFTLSNKPSIIKFDLYDNAEMLHLAKLLGDDGLVRILSSSINEKFVRGTSIYSVIDFFNSKGNKYTLRWAVMPYLYALSATHVLENSKF